MTTLLGPVPCLTCKAPVTVVRRPVVVWCDAKCRACAAQTGTKHRHGIATSLAEVAVVGVAGVDHRCVRSVAA
jgi:hypothetical protein